MIRSSSQQHVRTPSERASELGIEREMRGGRRSVPAAFAAAALVVLFLSSSAGAETAAVRGPPEERRGPGGGGGCCCCRGRRRLATGARRAVRAGERALAAHLGRPRLQRRRMVPPLPLPFPLGRYAQAIASAPAALRGLNLGRVDLRCRVTAMWLVWDYGERTGIKGWKGLSWGMVSVQFPSRSHPR